MIVAIIIVVIAIWQAGTTDESAELPPWLSRFNVTDLDTIRSILAAVIGGVFTLTIFAYTMVMNVLDRTIASYTPRFLPLLLSQRFHQWLLGISVGTIAHAIILLIVTAEDVSTPSPPILAAFTSGCLAISCLFIFIYYLHKVSESIHINSLLRLSFDHSQSKIRSLRQLKSVTLNNLPTAEFPTYEEGIRAQSIGYLNQLDLTKLSELAGKIGADLAVVKAPASFVHPGDLVLTTAPQYVSALRKELKDFHYAISYEVPDDVHTTGFKHMVEVAVKACSPAINDPGTALTALHYLTELFREYAEIGDFNQVSGNGGKVWITQYTLAELRDECFRELEQYMRDDPWAADGYARALNLVNGFIRD